MRRWAILNPNIFPRPRGGGGVPDRPWLLLPTNHFLEEEHVVRPLSFGRAI